MKQLINITIHIIPQLKKAVDVKSSTCNDFGTGNNEKNPKFRFGDHVRTSKYKSILAKGYIPKKIL